MDATPGQVDGTTESSGTSPSLVEREIMPDKSLQGGMTIDPPENLKRASAQGDKPHLFHRHIPDVDKMSSESKQPLSLRRAKKNM